jgi:hypothetical protein
MAYDPATADQYHREWTNVFQKGETYLKDTVMRETIMEGHSRAIFAFAGSAGRMYKRGVNGLIPARNATDTQVPISLEEKHTLEKMTSFNIFTSQSGGLKRAMADRSAKAAAREIDYTIIDALAAATTAYNSGSAVTLTLGKLVHIVSRLRANEVHGLLTFTHTPTSWAWLKTMPQFSSADYVDRKPLMGDDERPVMYAGARHVPLTGLPGEGTSTATLFVYAKEAVGHAVALDEVQTKIGYDDEQDYSFDRASIWDGAKILQQGGVLKVTHDDTAVPA